MNCADIDRLLSQGITPSELSALPGVQPHIAACPRCAALLHWAAAPLPSPEVPAPVLARIQSIVQQDLRPVAPLPALGTSLFAAFLLAALLAFLHAGIFGTRGWLSLATLQLAALFTLAILALGASATSLWSSLQPGARQPLPPLLPILLPAAGFPLLTALLFPKGPNHNFLTEGAICLTVGLLFAAVAAAVTARAARRGHATNPRLTGALIGAFSGLTGVVSLMISCPNHELAHMAIWHSLVILFAIVTGYRMGARALPSAIPMRPH